MGSFICDNYHAKWFFDGGRVNFMGDMGWFMKAWAVLQQVGILHGTSSEGILWLVHEANKHCIEVLLFLSAKVQHIMEGVHTYGVICRPSIFYTHILIYRPKTKWQTHTCLADRPFRFILKIFDGEEGLQGGEGRHFWYPIMNKEPGVKYQPLSQPSVRCYSSTSHLLKHHGVNESG